MTKIIEGVLEHACGWVSDGGAFPEGAGCPKCGEPIAVATDPNPPINLLNANDLASLTVPEVVGFISELPAGAELAEIELLEQAGEKRKGVLAAIRDRIAKLKGKP